MSKIFLTFPDPMLATLDVLRTLMPHITFGTLQPEDMTSSPVPYVMVRIDGSFRRMVTRAATMRVSVWHGTEAEGLAVAEYVEARLCAFPGDAQVRCFKPLTGPFPTNDPETGSPLASLTVSALLRPKPLTSVYELTNYDEAPYS